MLITLLEDNTIRIEVRIRRMLIMSVQRMLNINSSDFKLEFLIKIQRAQGNGKTIWSSGMVITTHVHKDSWHRGVLSVVWELVDLMTWIISAKNDGTGTVTIKYIWYELLIYIYINIYTLYILYINILQNNILLLEHQFTCHIHLKSILMRVIPL